LEVKGMVTCVIWALFQYSSFHYSNDDVSLELVYVRHEFWWLWIWRFQSHSRFIIYCTSNSISESFFCLFVSCCLSCTLSMFVYLYCCLFYTLSMYFFFCLFVFYCELLKWIQLLLAFCLANQECKKILTEQNDI
jgi:hypothetical protein